MRLHRGAPANVSSSDLTARQDQSRISTSQVKENSRDVFIWTSNLQELFFKVTCWLYPSNHCLCDNDLT